MIGQLLSAFYIAVGIYFVYAAYVKKGIMFNNPRIREDKKQEFQRLMSLFLYIIGPLLALAGSLELVKANPIYYFVCYTLVFVLVMVLLFMMSRLMKKGN